ncbi:beta-1,4-glucuronyltransferase 1-like [Arctopsyche grandis]|uniref:beta-1,4-glucuronyltransferase 1-like n=1 Tax=Arctopsyche grandis TaxID=121162 RepID=UPI00406D727B
MTVKDSEACFFIRFLVKSCKMRRLVLLFGILMCSISLLRIMHYRYYRRKSDNSGEYMLSDVSVLGTVKNPKDLPGYFMRGRYPSGNISYCNFKYGLPKKIDWSQVRVTGTPQLGKKSPYRVIYDAIERTMFDSSYALDHVTYATHVTPEFLYHVVEIARFWDGPISVAAFVPDYDLDLTMRLFTQLCRCYDGMSKVSVHLVFPLQDRPRFLKKDEQKIAETMKYFYKKSHKHTNNMPIQNTTTSLEKGINITTTKTVDIVDGKQNNDTTKNATKLSLEEKISLQMKKNKKELRLWFQDCTMPDMSKTKTYRSRYGLIYPVNVGRNVARNASSTQYNLVSDVEMVPSEGLATRFTLMVKRQKVNGHYGMIPKWRLAFVIPVFEVEAGEEIPRNKSSLQQLYADGKAVYFHRWVCSHCQKIPDLQNWIKEDPGKVIKPFAITKRQYPYHRWEPIYIATKHTPWYSETLSWEGRQDKMTQMLEMCLKSYDFVVVNGAFLCHAPGIKAKSKKRSWRYRHELVNTKQYDMIVKNLAEKYPANPKCRLE